MKIFRGINTTLALALLPGLLVGCGGGGGGGGTGPGGESSFGIVGASAPSRHYVEVRFSQDAGSEMAEPERYEIRDPSDRRLPVDSAEVDGDTVMLVTDAQESVDYALSVAATSGANPLATTFAGSLTGEPALLTAIPLSATSLLLTFSEVLDETSAETVGFYRVVEAGDDPSGEVRGLDVRSADLSISGLEVTLTTSPQLVLQYQVFVGNVRADVSGALIDPTLADAMFFGFDPDDQVAPQLLGADSIGSTTVLLSFSEAMENMAADPSNYEVTPELVVVGAELSEHRTRVVLTTLPQRIRRDYTVLASGLVDLSGNPIDPGANSAVFRAVEGDNNLETNRNPRVVGAISTSNTTVVVVYSKDMSGDADNPEFYSIFPESVNSEAGFLTVISGRFIGTSGQTAVELTTSSQSDVTYVLNAVGVTDDAGNPLARQETPPSTTDPGKATFAGTAPGLNELTDTDGDGLTDNVETLGWQVSVRLSDGRTVTRQVTSDLNTEDTDGDGILDRDEHRLATDPRNADTDGDGLSDFEEVNLLLTSPTDHDTDGDGVGDRAEVEFFKTNALNPDSDGDGFDDRRELFEVDRDPRLADMPAYDFSVGNTRLQIDERYTFTDESGNTKTESSSTATTIAISDSTSRLSTTALRGNFVAGIAPCSSDCDVTKINPPDFPTNLFLRAKAEGGFERLTQTDRASARAAEDAFQRSIEKGQEFSTSSTVTREVVDARIDVDLTFHNLGDIAFSVRNVEMTVLASDPSDSTRLIPVASLLPAAELDGGGGVGLQYRTW